MNDSQTPSSVLMEALESVETAASVLIIIRHRDDDLDKVSWHQFPNSYIETLGMLDFTRNAILKKMERQ